MARRKQCCMELRLLALNLFLIEKRQVKHCTGYYFTTNAVPELFLCRNRDGSETFVQLSRFCFSAPDISKECGTETRRYGIHCIIEGLACLWSCDYIGVIALVMCAICVYQCMLYKYSSVPYVEWNCSLHAEFNHDTLLQDLGGGT